MGKAKSLKLDVSDLPSLHDAVRKADVDAIRRLCQWGVSLREPEGALGSTPLHLACERGLAQIAELILRRDPVSANVTDRQYNSPLHVCAQHGELAAQCARTLLDLGADAEMRNGQGYTPLLVACLKRNTHVARVLLEHKCDVRASDREQRTPLHWAALSGYEDVMKLLLDFNAPVSALDATGATPLHNAAISGHAVSCELLVRAGAPVDELDSDLATPLLLASRKSHARVVHVLLNLGATPTARDRTGRTPLHVAAAAGALDCLLMMCEKQPDVNVLDDKGVTPLMLAAVNVSEQCVRTLLQHNASVDTRDKLQRSVFHYAARGGNGAIMRSLSTAASEQDLPLTVYTDSDAADMTPLMIAASCDHLDAVSALLTIGVDPRSAIAVAQGSSKMLLERAIRMQESATVLRPTQTSDPFGPSRLDSSQRPLTRGSVSASRPSTAASHVDTVQRAIIDRLLQTQNDERELAYRIALLRQEIQDVSRELDDATAQVLRTTVATEEQQRLAQELTAEMTRLQRSIRRYEDERSSPYLTGSRVVAMGGRRVALITPERVVAQLSNTPALAAAAAARVSSPPLGSKSPEALITSPPTADKVLVASLDEMRKKVSLLQRQHRQLTAQLAGVPEVSSLQRDLKYTRQQLGEDESELARLKARFEAVTALRDKAKSQLTNAVAATQKVHQQVSELEQRLRVDLQAATKDSSVLQTLESQLAELRDRLAADERTEASAKKDVSDLSSELERVRAQLEQVRVVPEEAQQRARQIEQWRQEAAQMWVAVASIKRARNESNYSPAVQPEAKPTSTAEAQTAMSLDEREASLREQERKVTEQETTLQREEHEILAQITALRAAASQFTSGQTDGTIKQSLYSKPSLQQKLSPMSEPVAPLTVAPVDSATERARQQQLQAELTALNERRGSLDAQIREARAALMQRLGDVELMERVLRERKTAAAQQRRYDM